MRRREFIVSTALAAATATAARVAVAQPSDADELTWSKAPCRFCGTGCHMQVGVKDGRVVAVAGDRLAPVNRGLLCVKGYHVGLALYGSDRLRQPLLRRGTQQVPIDWDRAIDIIADRIEINPQGFAMYGSGQWTIPEGFAANKFMKAGLSNNHIDPNARLCMASAVTGFLSTYGVDEPASCFDDLDRCDVLILWGNNPAEMHPVLFSRVLDRRARGDDVLIIDIGTRRTRSTSFAQEYLEFRPNTDLAIANGVAHLLLRRGNYDREFVSQYCRFRADADPQAPTLQGEELSFVGYERRLQTYTPERVEDISGVPAAKIRDVAALFGNRDLRITSLWCMGMNQHTRGTAINRLVHGLHLLSGHWGREGDGPQSLTGQPAACGTVREVGTLAHALPGGRVVTNPVHRRQAETLWNVPPGRISGEPGYHTVELWKRFSASPGAGGDIHTIWVQAANPAQTLPNRSLLFDRSQPDKFLIVSDVYPTETTRAADLVLPSAMWVEKNGMFGNSERRTQQWFKMVDPPGQARDDCWQIVAVARKLFERGFPGMQNQAREFLFSVENERGEEVPIWEWPRYYDVNVDRALFEEYRPFTRLKHKDLAPYDEYVAARGLRWPVVHREGAWRETRYRFVEGEDPYVDENRGIQFYHSTTGDDKAQIWFHEYEPPPEEPDGEYPFWLCTGRVLEHWHSGTMTMRIPQLRRAMPNAYVEINETDARRIGIGNGDEVVVETRRGSLKLPAWIDGRGQPPAGSLFIPFFDEQLLVNDLTLEAYDPISKQPDFKKCAARIRRAVELDTGSNAPMPK